MLGNKAVVLSVRDKFLIIVFVCIFLTTIPGLAIIYFETRSNIIQGEIESLLEETDQMEKLSGQRFIESGGKLRGLARQLQRALAAPVNEAELESFAQRFVLFPDGVIRNSKAAFDGTQEAGLFLPAEPPPSDTAKIQHLRIKQVMDSFGAAATRPYENVYFLSPLRSEIVFDQNNPDYVYAMPAEIDYTQTPWYQLCTPENNPGKELRFTPPLYEPVMDVWMVSAVLPVYVEGRWLGSIGEDMVLTNALALMFESASRYSGEEHFLLDAQGNLILAGPWQALLGEDPAAAKSTVANIPSLQNLLQKKMSGSAALLNDHFILQGERYVAIGLNLDHVDWSYYRLIPVSQILAPMQRFVYALLFLILLMSIVTGLSIAAAATRLISRPIMQLAGAMRRFGGGDLHLAPELLQGKDEIGFAARTFAEMAAQLEQAISEIRKDEAMLKELNATLADKVAEKTQDLELSLAKLQEAQAQLIQTEKMGALMHIIAGVCHEINTPLGNALMACSLCEDAFSQLEGAQAVRELSDVQLQELVVTEKASWELTKNCLQQVVQLLQRFELVHADDEAFIQVDYQICEVVQRVAERYQPRLVAAGVDFSWDCQVEGLAHGNPGAIERVMEIIIDNAMEHGRPSFITIMVQMVGMSLCQVRIGNSGQPIPSEVLPRIFDPFYTNSSDPTHAGLGLSIAYNFVTKSLGGEIQCLSSAEGTEFVFCFPLDADSRR